MTKVLVLDESGVIDSKHQLQRYFVLGGILYDIEDLQKIKETLIPQFDMYKKIINKNELKSNDLSSAKNNKNLIYGAALSLINSVNEIKPIIYILDKTNAYTIKNYNKKSFKYNKLIQFLIKDLLDDNIIDEEDDLIIVIDRIDLSSEEKSNILTWLPSNENKIKEVIMTDSKESYFIQAADLIAGIPKLKGINPRQIIEDPKLMVLSRCYLKVFPKYYEKDLI